MNVYVAAPYQLAGYVREIHSALRACGLCPTSTWAENATGAEDFSNYSERDLRRLAEENDRGIACADVVLVHSRKGMGGETYAEARLALMLGKVVYWTGDRLTLSAWRKGVHRVEDVEEALRCIARIAGVA